MILFVHGTFALICLSSGGSHNRHAIRGNAKPGSLATHPLIQLAFFTTKNDVA